MVRLITKHFVAGEMSVTGVPGSKKWPVAPASDISMSTAILVFDLLIKVSDWGGGVVIGYVVGWFASKFYALILTA